MKSFKQLINEVRFLTPAEKRLPLSLQPKDAVSSVEDKPETNTDLVSSQPEEQPTEKPTSKVITMGPSSKITAPKVKGPQSSPMYKVGANETLDQIARKHGTTTQELLKINQGIKNSSSIPQGTQIRTRK